jgi:DNA-binding transcriptional LysR family regulator
VYSVQFFCSQGKLNYGIVGAKYYSEVLEYIDFYEDEIVLCLPEGERNPWSDKDLLDIKTLFSEKFIFRKPGSGTRRLIEERLSEKGIDLDDLNIISYIDSNEMIKKMVELGLGISFISKIAVKNECDLKLIKTLRIKDLDLRRNFYFVYNKNRTLPPLVEAFKDFLISWKY